MIETEIRFTDFPLWCKVITSMQEITETLHTGLLQNKPVEMIRLYEVAGDGETLYLLYDIVSAKKGSNPWRTQTFPL